METLLWIIVIVLFALSFIGLVMPIIPSSIALWLGFIIYHFFINQSELTVIFWFIMFVFTAILIVSDFMANRFFVNKFGGSKKGEYAAMIGLIFGVFIWPPVGIILVPFIAVLVVELSQQRTFREAVYSSIGSLIGFLSGMAIKVIIQVLMISIFIFYLII